MADDTLLNHVADIVSAHVSNNSVSSSDLPALIQSVYASVASLGQTAEPAEETRTPAVSVRASVKPEAVTCLDCGKKMKMLKRHIGTDHGLTPAAYRARWNLPADYPMVAPDYAAKRAELAIQNGLGRKPGQSPKAQPVTTKVARPRKKLGVVFE
ncbi:MULTISPECIES: MucR family transcriptional regulator [unclassified Sphingomonas]|uniref:MucR family transcriptional regulator n=1 Tax=Novosphingobium rhizosphaerae TaxID=1551649 RepID=UPI0015C8A504